MDPVRFLNALQVFKELDQRMATAWVWCEDNECFPVLERQQTVDGNMFVWTVCGRFWSETPLLAAEAAMEDEKEALP